MKHPLYTAKPAILAFVPAWVLCAILEIFFDAPVSETFTNLFLYMALFFLCGTLLSLYYARSKGALGWETGIISLLLLADLFLRNGVERLAALVGDGRFGSYLAAVLETVLWDLGYDTGMSKVWSDPRFYLLAVVMATLLAGAFTLGFHWKDFVPEKK